MCNSTLFTSALSCLTTFFIPSDSIIVFAITVNSPENWSICAFPSIVIPFAFFILPIIFLLLFLSKNALQVIVLEPSYKSKLSNVFPDFNSLSSINITSPFKDTVPSSAPKSATFTNGALILIFLPNINGVSSSSSGSSGTSISTSTIWFVITVISPSYVSKPAFPVTLIAFAFLIFSTISPDSSGVEKDLHVNIPVPS